MAYSTLEDIKVLLPEEDIQQLSDDAGGQIIDSEKVQEAIAYGDELIDGYLRGRYTVPLNPVAGLIKVLSVNLAIYRLYERRFGLNMPESLMERHKHTIRTLEQIQKGLIKLGIETEKGPGEGYYEGNKTLKDRVFNKGVLRQF